MTKTFKYTLLLLLQFFISYENTKTRKEVDEYFKEKKKKNIEL